MDYLSAHKLFFAVAEQASFSAAARSLGVSPSAASRGVAELEAKLQTVLLRRSTRAVTLTSEGTLYLEHSRKALADLEEAAALLTSSTTDPVGPLNVSAPVSFGRLHVLPVIGTLLRRHRGLSVRLQLADRVVGLSEEGVDLAIRIGSLSDSGLHAAQLGETRQILVANQDYLARMGTPSQIADLTEHDLIAFEELPGADIRWQFPSGEVVHVRPRLRVNKADAAIGAACEGLGVVRAYSYQAAAELASGQLVRLLCDSEPDPVPINALYQAGRGHSPSIRAVIEQMKDYMRKRAF